MPLNPEDIKAKIVKNENEIKALEKKDFNFKSEVSLRSQVVNDYIELVKLMVKNSGSELEEYANKLIGQCNVLYGIYHANNKIDKMKKVKGQILEIQEKILNKSSIKNANTRASNVNTTPSTRVAYDSFGTPIKTPRAALTTKDSSIISIFADDPNASPKTRIEMMEFATSSSYDQIVEKILSCDIHSKDDFGYGMIHLAAMDGHLEIVKTLIEKDPNLINDSTRDGSLPIHLAVKSDNKDLVELLVDKDVKCIEVPDGHGYLPIHLATIGCEKDLVELLIEKNVDINALSRNNQSPLEFAIINNKKDIVELLIGKNVNTDIKTSDGSTLIELAERRKNVGILNLLLANSSQYGTDNLERSMSNDWGKEVVYAIQCNKERRFKELLYDKNSTFILSPRYCTIVHVAASYGRENILKLIIHKTEEDSFSNLVSKTDKEGNTALHLASLEGNESIMSLLINNSNDDKIFNTKNKKGRTPLHCAVESGKDDAVKLLLGNRLVCVNEADKNSDTPLHLAISLGYTSIAKLLIEEKKVNIDVQNKYDITPLHLAAKNGNCAISELLINRGANIRACDEQKNSVLHFAASSNSFSIIEKLLKLGAGIYVNTTNNNGFTPIQLAEDNHSGEALNLFNRFKNNELPFQQKRQRLNKHFQTSIDKDDLGVTPLSSVDSPSSERHNNSSRGRVGGL